MWKSVRHARIQHGMKLHTHMIVDMRIMRGQKNVVSHMKNRRNNDFYGG